MGRAPCCDKANVKKGPWSPEEDAKLKSYIEEHGTGGNWIALPLKIGLKRCGKSCRLRWLNYLRPNIRHGGFTEEEDRIICNLFISIGSRWSIIAAQLPGRTDNDIKNYFNTRLKKKLLGRRRDSTLSSQLCHLTPEHELKMEGSNPNTNVSTQTLTASAIERLQLCMQLQGLHTPFSFYHPHGNEHKLFQTLNTDVIPIFVSPLKHPQKANMSNSMFTNLEGSLGVSSSSCSNLHTELDDLIYGKENQHLADLDCFKEMNYEEEIGLWGSRFDEKSSSSSWDSASALQPDSVFLEYGTGYYL